MAKPDFQPSRIASYVEPASAYAKKKPRKWPLIAAGLVLLAIGACLALAVFVFLVPTNTRDNANPVRRAEMKEIPLEWGRFAPFPKNARNFSIHTEGGSFTRTFRGSFSDSPESVAEWIHGSPGIVEGQSEILDDQSTKYILKTGGGASYGEVTISADGSHVTFRVSWS